MEDAGQRTPDASEIEREVSQTRVQTEMNLTPSASRPLATIRSHEQSP
jgi:hypothetical protein